MRSRYVCIYLALSWPWSARHSMGWSTLGTSYWSVTDTRIPSIIIILTYLYVCFQVMVVLGDFMRVNPENALKIFTMFKFTQVS